MVFSPQKSHLATGKNPGALDFHTNNSWDSYWYDSYRHFYYSFDSYFICVIAINIIIIFIAIIMTITIIILFFGPTNHNIRLKKSKWLIDLYKSKDIKNNDYR